MQWASQKLTIAGVIIPCKNIRFSSPMGTFREEERNVPGGEERGETDVFAGYCNNVTQDINRWSTVMLLCESIPIKLLHRNLKNASEIIFSFTRHYKF